jgi:hypothetical protein
MVFERHAAVVILLVFKAPSAYKLQRFYLKRSRQLRHHFLNVAFFNYSTDAVLSCSRVTIGEAVILISDKQPVSLELTITEQAIPTRLKTNVYFEHRLYFRIKD